MENNKQRYAMLLVMGFMLSSALFLGWITALNAQIDALKEQPFDCWQWWISNSTYFDQSWHIWNYTESEGRGSCDLLKDVCYYSQVNYQQGISDYNCRWFYNDSFWHGAACVCSHTQQNIINMTRIEAMN